MELTVFPRARWAEVRLGAVHAEAAVVAAAFSLLWWQGDRLDHAWPVTSAAHIFTLLSLAAACVATGAAIVARMIPASVGDVNRRLAGPLAFYGVIMIPAGLFHLPNDYAPALAVGGFVAGTLFLAMLWWTLKPDLFASLRWPSVVTVAVFLSLTAGLAAQVYPLTSDPAGPTTATVIVVIGWFLMAVLFVVVGGKRDQPVTWRVGLGLGMIAVAHLDELVLRPEVIRPDVDFAAMRLVGLLVVLFALARPAVRAVREAGRREREQADRLGAAERAANRLALDVAEREHELRNLVSGLSGVSHVLGERTPLGSAVQAELERVRYLLGHAASQDGVVLLAPLLTRLVALHRARGTNIQLRVDSSLKTTMPAAELAQVVTNLLVNCERHAPGSLVSILAGGHGQDVWIEVSDDGPGFAPKGRRGIGLRVSARLLAEYGGTLQIGSRRRGCVAFICVPGADGGRTAEAM